MRSPGFKPSVGEQSPETHPIRMMCPPRCSVDYDCWDENNLVPYAENFTRLSQLTEQSRKVMFCYTGRRSIQGTGLLF